MRSTPVEFPEHPAENLIIVESVRLLDVLDAPVRIQYIYVDLVQPDCIHIFQECQSHILLKEPGEINLVQTHLRSDVTDTDLLGIMNSHVIYDILYTLQIALVLSELLIRKPP